MRRLVQIFCVLSLIAASPAIAQTFEGDFYVGDAGTAPGGEDPDYASLWEAFQDLAANPATGPITLHITSDLDERGYNLLLNNLSFTADKSLTIRPMAGATPTVTLGAIEESGVTIADGATLAIVNTPYVTIDGSNEEGGTSRDLTIIADNLGGSTGIRIYGSAHHTTVRNVRLITSTPGPTLAGVRVGTGNVAPENTLLENNQIGSDDGVFFHGIALVGAEGATINMDIIDNDIYASQRGITTWYVGEARYEGNRIRITGQFVTTSWSAGIYVVTSHQLHVAGNEILGFNTNNIDQRPNAAFLFNANAGDIWVYNNTVAVPEFTNHGSYPSAEFFGFGVNWADAGSNHFIYHNTVRIGSSTEDGPVAGFGFAYHVAMTGQGWELRNNIIVVEDSSPEAYAIYWPVEGTEPEIDDNNLYAPNAKIGHWRGNDFETLGEWQFGAALDGNSVSKAVEFVSDLDLRLTGSSIGDHDLAGVPLPLVTVDIDGTERDEVNPYMGAFEGSVGLPIETSDGSEIASAFELHQNYPNPFNPSTTIGYNLREPGHVRILIFDISGRKVAVLANGYEGVGGHEVTFDAGDLASGMYLYRIEFEGRSETKQMMLIK